MAMAGGDAVWRLKFPHPNPLPKGEGAEKTSPKGRGGRKNLSQGERGQKKPLPRGEGTENR